MNGANDPAFEAPYQLGLRAAESGDFVRAVEFYDAAIAVRPEHAEVYYKRGNALRNAGRLEAAISSYSQAIERRTEYAHAYCNRGVAQQALGLTPEALFSYDRAIAIDPADATSHYNRALLMQDLLRWDEALASYDRAIALDPRNPDAQYNRAVLQLFCGNYAEGWRNYEWRWKNARQLGIGEAREFPQRLWLGDCNIAGKRLLLHCEAGLGDSIQFCRYVPLVADLGASVILEVPAPLRDLLSGLKGVLQVVAQGEVLPTFDLHCPLMSLPLACKTSLHTVPAPRKYLQSHGSAAARWRSELPPRTWPRVGLAWSGNPGNAIDQRRSISARQLLEFLPDGHEYFCLQKDVRAPDEAVLACTPLIRRIDAKDLDFVSTAALCEAMDLIITVDTSLVHLAGALGCPTWLLLPLVPDWRWMRDRSDTPWYPTVKLYRQTRAGDWREVLSRVAADLRERSRFDQGAGRILLD